MSSDFDALDPILIQAAAANNIAIAAGIFLGGELAYLRVFGYLDPPAHQRPITTGTLFDLASLTKLFTTTAFMRLVEEGQVYLDSPVCSVLPEFSGFRPLHAYEDPLEPGHWIDISRNSTAPVDSSSVTFRQLLSHTSGLPAWRPLFQQADAAASRRMALETFFSYPPGAQVVYSDLGLILTGIAVEQITGERLDEVILQMVSRPLGLTHTLFRPMDRIEFNGSGNFAPTEFCTWRKRRMVGEVDDENAYQLGGIAGHAGLFSTVEEVARFGESMRRSSLAGLDGLLRQHTMAEMTALQAENGLIRRGLGFVLSSADPEGSGFPFGPEAFGHTGFTGTSLWIDPKRELSVALLTNEVYNGRQNREIGRLRLEFHEAVVAAANGLL